MVDHDTTVRSGWPMVVVLCVALLMLAVPADASRNLPNTTRPTLDGPVVGPSDFYGKAPVRPHLPLFSAADIVALSYGYDAPDQVFSLTRGGSSVGRLFFQGLWTDPVTGIAYARNRWYDARTASWLSEDPMGAVDSPNLYAFVGWGPHMYTDPMGLASLVIYTASIKPGDAATFQRAAEKLADERRAAGQDVILAKVETGAEIVELINSQPEDSIESLDIVSHGNPGGIHIARKIEPADANWLERLLHFRIRRGSDRPQTREDAEKKEEEAVGLYTGRSARQVVSLYYNQEIGEESALLSEIEFDRFECDVQVEFHGCRTAEEITVFDNFAVQFSQELDNDASVTAHTGPSSPQGKKHDYRHGPRVILKNGKVVGTLNGKER